MRIKAGKSYRNGWGERVDIEYADYRFRDQFGIFYNAQGLAYTVADKKNIVSEWVAPIELECKWDSVEGILRPVASGIVSKLRPFVGKKTKVTIEVIE